MSELFLYSVRLVGMVAMIYVAITLVIASKTFYVKLLLSLLFSGQLSYLLINASYPSVPAEFRFSSAVSIYAVEPAVF